MTGIIEQIYFSSPIVLQQIFVAAFGWRWYHRRFGGKFLQLVAEYRDREWWSEEQFCTYQAEQLARILTQAQQSTYYRSVFDRYLDQGINQQPFEVLKKLPLLSKEVLRTNPEGLLTSIPIPKRTMVFKSSGTTGTPTEIYYTPEFHALELAVPEARNLAWASISSKDRRVMFGVRKVCRFDQNRPPFWRYSPAENMAYASIYHLSPLYIPEYLKFLREYQPAMIMGYPSALNTIAKYALEHHDLPSPARAVFTTSETLTEASRENIEAAWRCRIYDRYGAVEGCLFASQCEFGRYHVSPEVGIIEILDNQGNECPPGVLGEVICTGLQNTLQPLIRYHIGDAAMWAIDQDCPCGRKMPIIEAIDGRIEDICFTPDGRQMLRFDTVFKGVVNIREAQIVQKNINLFVIKVIPTGNFDEHDIETLKHNFALHAGNVLVKIEVVEEIPRSSSGKFRAVICELTAEEKLFLQTQVVHG